MDRTMLIVPAIFALTLSVSPLAGMKQLGHYAPRAEVAVAVAPAGVLRTSVPAIPGSEN